MHHLLLVLAGLVVAGGLGYFIGYDHGFDNSAAPAKANAFEQASVSDAATTMANVIGMWRSTEDPSFTREIRNDGVVVDRYAGEADSDGLWMVFTKDIPDTSFTGTIEEGAVYLSMSMSEDEKYYFKVTNADGRNLELIYLDRGGALSFVRVN
jgi:hypothetical protein